MDNKEQQIKTEALKRKLRRQGRIALGELLKCNGGSLSAQDTAARLNIPQQQLMALKQEDRIFSVMLDEIEHYPIWQFDAAIQEHFQPLLAILLKHSDVAKLQFFLSTDENLNGLTRLEALMDPTQNDLNYITREAKVLNTHTCK